MSETIARVAELVDLSADCLPNGMTGRRAETLSMYIVYAISSISRNYIYVGLTSNLENRLARHNGKRERTTASYAPFTLLYTESAETRPAARIREKYWKSGAGKEKLRRLRDHGSPDAK